MRIDLWTDPASPDCTQVPEVLGAALAMQMGGLSMAMGAFLAGVLLSESTFRHQLEADVEPFRAILLGLFFLSVGMSLDVSVVVADWRLVIGGVVVFGSTVVSTMWKLICAVEPSSWRRRVGS